MSGLALVQYGGCENHWNNVQIRASNESTPLQPDTWTDDPETHGVLALIMNRVSHNIMSRLKSINTQALYTKSPLVFSALWLRTGWMW